MNAVAIPQRVKDLIAQGDYLFSKRQPLMSLWQEIADNFYPERADFTFNRQIGEDFAANLLTSYPIQARRDLGNLFSPMLRPRQTEWFKNTIKREDRLDHAGRLWLERSTKIQKRAMYDDPAGFIRATKETDQDYAAFGQGVISCEVNYHTNTLLYRNSHLRDVVWCEGLDRKVDTIHKQWKPAAVDLNKTFKGNVHPKVKELLLKEPYREIRCRHIVVPVDKYEPKDANGKAWRTPFVSIHIDIENEFIMEEKGSWTRIYTIPRWQTQSGTQYAYSPSTVSSLPDARLIQAMTLVLLEAGEKAVNPPMIGTEGALRSDVNTYQGGITWVDKDYDEKLGEALRPLPADYSGLPMGMEMRDQIKADIYQAFFLNKINLPQIGPKMTAFEVSQRVAEYVRNALPLFEPMEVDYNGSLCEITFETLMRNGAFGSVQDMPDSLRGEEVQFTFTSPLHEAAEKQKGEMLIQTKALMANVADLDPASLSMLKVQDALRDALTGIGTPTEWLFSKEEMAEAAEDLEAAKQTKQMMAMMQEGAMAAEQMGKAGIALNEMQAGGM